MIKKILSWINTAIDFIQKFVWIITILLGVTSFASLKGCIDQKEEKSDVIEVLTTKAKQFKTESGKNASKVNEWKIKYQSLERLNSEISHENNAYLKELSKAKETIQDLNIRLKDVKTYIKNELISKDSIRTEIEFVNCEKIKIKPIETDHIKIDIVQIDRFLDVSYEYNANVSTVVSREKNKDQFFLWRWIRPKWEYNSISIIDDPNATIENNVNIEFKK